MAAGSCSFDCRVRPTSLQPNSDLTGIGVIVGYTGTAGIVVLILLFHYIASYDATKDPFEQKTDNVDTTDLSFRANPIDSHLLKVRQLWKRYTSQTQRQDHAALSREKHLESMLVKCILSMSDLQILTGLSILISGYTQLRCGISCYHWGVLAHLAWFSSITHLSCLTFLRSYLHQRPAEKAWRIAAMAVVVIMLIVALIPTMNYGWYSSNSPDSASQEPSPFDTAICYLKRTPLPQDANPSLVEDRYLALVFMLASILLLGLGFVQRVLRLSPSITVNIGRRWRSHISRAYQSMLDKVYRWSAIEKSPNSLRRTLVYRPLLAVFLVSRITADMWTSMFLEVYWLLISFIWGVLRLSSNLSMQPLDNSTWAFGQVVPVVLLAAPVLTFIEHYSSGQTSESQSDSHGTSHTPAQSQTVTTSQGLSRPDQSKTAIASNTASIDPFDKVDSPTRVETLELAAIQADIPDGIQDKADTQFHLTTWYATLQILAAVEVLTIGFYIIIGAIDMPTLFYRLDPEGLTWGTSLDFWPLSHVYSCGCFIMNALLIEVVQVKRVRVLLSVLNCLAFLSMLVLTWHQPWKFFYIGVYAVASFVYKIFGHLSMI